MTRQSEKLSEEPLTFRNVTVLYAQLVLIPCLANDQSVVASSHIARYVGVPANETHHILRLFDAMQSLESSFGRFLHT